MKDIFILGIETSCDETSVSVVKNGRNEIATTTLSQIDIHEIFGGVVPEIASRSHVENITIIIEDCLKKAYMTLEEIDAIAVTAGPGLIGSLLIGVEAAKTLAFVFDKPLIGVNHMVGHIYGNAINNDLKFPLLALVVSGGHTQIIKMTGHMSFEVLGSTLDDAVGECYDKVARVIGLPYPGGPKLDEMAVEEANYYNLPLPLDDASYNFSFSGLKSAVINLKHNEEQRGNTLDAYKLATSFQTQVVEILSKKTMRALNKYHIDNLIIAGGVSANKGLRKKLDKLCQEKHINLNYPDFKYCTDNATMIACAGYYYFINNMFEDLSLEASAVDSIDGD